MSRCPAARLVVRWTPRATGRMSRLIVLIGIRAGISGVGVPSGRRCPREIEGWFRKPVSREASQSGKASAMFIDSWVVGVNVYGNRPSRLIVSRNIIRDIRIRVHLRPFLFSGINSCFAVKWRNHDWMVRRRLVTHRLSGVGSSSVGNSIESRRLVTHRLSGVGSSSVGNSIESRIRGIPKRYGIANLLKKLKFTVRFRG